MERILVFSDTHGQTTKVKKIISSIPDVTGVIHLGDVLRDVYALEKEFEKIPFYYVAGNNDYFSDLPREMIVKLGKYKALVTHGHAYYVNMGYDHLVREARKRKVDMVIYGHTHRPVITEENGIKVLNPGSLTYPRQEGRKYTYIIMEIDENGEIECTLHQL